MSDIFQCDKCPQSFKTNSGLWKHTKNKHKNTDIERHTNVQQNTICGCRN